MASDLSEIATRAPLPEDHVLGVCTGYGVQAVHLAEHADAITVTDLSQRALEFVGFNVALNELDVEVLGGSVLEPVSGRRFDLVVSNPPFVITPRLEGTPEYEYRDGGAMGDGIVRSLVRTVGDHLEPGGIAQFLGNWEMRAGETFESV